MVLIILNTIQFEAEKFETRTMPTPDMKSKEMIYWIRVDTTDKRLVSELQRFLEGASQHIELHVPSAFVAVKTELESYRASNASSPSGSKEEPTSATVNLKSSSLNEKLPSGSPEAAQQQGGVEERFIVEIILRRPLTEAKGRQTQSPYG